MIRQALMRRRFHSRWLAVLLMAILIVPEAAFARYEPKPGRPNFFSLDQEVQLGQQEAVKVDKQMPIVNDADLNRYIQHLGARLVAKAPGPKYPYTFKIVDQKDVNAFALPGGPIHINLGTIQATDSEAELAGVVAHEMSHVIMRHSTHMASQQMLAQAPLSILGGIMGNGVGSQLAQLGISFAAGSVFMKYSRDAEKQADLVGAGIMHDAGFDPQQMVEFFRKLEEQGGSSSAQFLSDHPNPGNRVQYVEAEVQTLPRVPYSQDSAEFRQIKQKVGGMRPLSAQEIQQQQQTGANPGNQTASRSQAVYPNGQTQTLNHSAYSVSYPANWQVFGDANSEVTIAPQQGITQNAIAYGVIINGFQPEQQQSGSASLDDATHQLLSQLRQSNPDLRQVGRDEDLRLNAGPAKSVIMVGPSPIVGSNNRPEQERDWLVAMQRQDGLVIYFVFIAPQQDFGQLKPAFDQMLRSVRLK